LKSVKEMTAEHIKIAEERIVELEKELDMRKVGLQNLKESLETDKKYLASLKD
jgi:hypothetical protein